MVCLEMIEMRSAENKRTELEKQLRSFMSEVKLHGNLQTVTIYQNGNLPTDYCIQLIHYANQLETEGSALGLSLVHSLKELGLVHHTIWRQITQPDNTVFKKI